MASSPIETFFAAWGETDDDARLTQVSAAVAPGASYGDPMTPEPITGPDAVANYVAMFAQNAPGATASVIDSQERHGVTRATVAFTMADGQTQHGQYFVESDSDGKIARMVGFVGVPDIAAT